MSAVSAVNLEDPTGLYGTDRRNRPGFDQLRCGCSRSWSPCGDCCAEGTRTTPSVVGYTKDELLVGQPARRQLVLNPQYVFQPQTVVGRLDELDDTS